MFDLTKNIELSDEDRKKYKRWQAVLYAVAFLGLIYFILFFLMFPKQNYFFSFDNNSDRNINLEVKGEGQVAISDGNLTAAKKYYVNVPLDGDFSSMSISTDIDQKQINSNLAKLRVRRSFQSFFYPEGKPVGFKDGWLVRVGTDHYIISQGKARKFNDSSIIEKMGFDPDAFISIKQDELEINPSGDDIIDPNSYPDSTVFEVEGKYYALKNEQLNQFISKKAFLTHYRDDQAIPIDKDFLSSYPIAGEQVGFADGSLISNPDAVFVVEGGSIYAIGSVDIFSIKGFSWDNVIQADPEEMSYYPNVTRAKIFTSMSPHPRGTVFQDEKNGNYYIVGDIQKLPIGSKNIADSWSNRKPVEVSEVSLDVYDDCVLARSLWKSRRYSCKINIENLSVYPGTDYEIEVTPNENFRVNYIDMSFKKNFSKYNLKRTYDSIISQLTKNYGGQ